MWRRERLNSAGSGAYGAAALTTASAPSSRIGLPEVDMTSYPERAAGVDRETDHGVSLLLFRDGLRRVAPEPFDLSADLEEIGVVRAGFALQGDRILAEHRLPAPPAAASPLRRGGSGRALFPGALSARRSSPFPVRRALAVQSMRVVRARTSAWPASEASTKGMRNFFVIMG